RPRAAADASSSGRAGRRPRFSDADRDSRDVHAVQAGKIADCSEDLVEHPLVGNEDERVHSGVQSLVSQLVLFGDPSIGLELLLPRRFRRADPARDSNRGSHPRKLETYVRLAAHVDELHFLVALQMRLSLEGGVSTVKEPQGPRLLESRHPSTSIEPEPGRPWTGIPRTNEVGAVLQVREA